MADFKVNVNFSDIVQKLNTVGDIAGRGSKRAVTAAVQEILTESLAQVPELTGTLAASAYTDVRRVFGAGYRGTVGYGGNGDPINPLTGQRASQYMIAVHEDLEAKHDKGKAKFLEDPVNAYTEKFFNDAANIIRESID